MCISAAAAESSNAIREHNQPAPVIQTKAAVENHDYKNARASIQMQAGGET
jgi:hypothetical protein